MTNPRGRQQESCPLTCDGPGVCAQTSLPQPTRSPALAFAGASIKQQTNGRSSQQFVVCGAAVGGYCTKNQPRGAETRSRSRLSPTGHLIACPAVAVRHRTAVPATSPKYLRVSLFHESGCGGCRSGHVRRCCGARLSWLAICVLVTSLVGHRVSLHAGAECGRKLCGGDGGGRGCGAELLCLRNPRVRCPNIFPATRRCGRGGARRRFLEAFLKRMT